MRRRFTFSNVVSLMALFVALSGGAYAAVSVPANSVGPRQLRANAVTKGKVARNSIGANQLQAGAVTTSKLRPGAVTGAQVKPGSLTGADINLATLGTVPTAATANAATVARVNTATASGTASGSGASATATCAPGLTVVGGGVSVADEPNEVVNDSYPSGSNGWTGHVFAGTAGGTAFTVYAICAPAASTS